MVNLAILVPLTIAICATIVIISVSSVIFYKTKYINLRRNFNSYINNVERKTIKADVILHNAILEALDQAREKNNKFEEKAYSDLLEKMKGKW